MSSPDISDDSTLGRYRTQLFAAISPSAQDARDIARRTRASRSARDESIRQAIVERWKEGWDHLDAVIFAMEQNAVLMSRRADETDDIQTPLRWALLLTHSAATATVHEIRTLLLAGLWAGAAARWRTLHELAVTGTILATSDTDTSQRYLDHGFVVQTKRLREFHIAHGRGPVARDELDERWTRAQALIQLHRDLAAPVTFAAAHAWATPLLPVGKSGRRPRPTFDALEALAGMADLRLLVGTAHGMVHGDGGGITAAVVEDDGLVVSPTDRHIDTVARPTLLTIGRMVAATHLGFEAELNEFARVLGLLGGALVENTRLATDAFTR